MSIPVVVPSESAEPLNACRVPDAELEGGERQMQNNTGAHDFCIVNSFNYQNAWKGISTNSYYLKSFSGALVQIPTIRQCTHKDFLVTALSNIVLGV